VARALQLPIKIVELNLLVRYAGCSTYCARRWLNGEPISPQTRLRLLRGALEANLLDRIPRHLLDEPAAASTTASEATK
jgi:hypothetical protein